MSREKGDEEPPVMGPFITKDAYLSQQEVLVEVVAMMKDIIKIIVSERAVLTPLTNQEPEGDDDFIII